MKRFSIITIVVLALTAVALCDTAQAGPGSLLGARAKYRAPYTSWTSGYYSAAWGMPVALVVPPTAERQMNWGWGVGNSRVTTIWPQFHRNYPGPYQYDCRTQRPTPLWPSDTTQFGTYYVRGPW
ncbi:MAG TPA: hypothetical protein VJL29_11240 [Thermoguttaceae bacterium]|nr:hypothetical protein [Thermoguttaceae bacterium]